MGEGLEADVSNGRRWSCIAVWAGLCAGAWAQQAPVAALSGTDASATLSAMAGQAAVIFAGQVTAIARHDDAGYVQVTFSVDEAVAGCGTDSQFVLREWVGLWTGHEPRYRVGQRLLMMLHAPNAAGLSSPVNGMDGAIPLLGAGAPALMDSGGNVAADSGTGGPGASLAADLSWVQARALRGVSMTTVALTKRPVAKGAPVVNGAPIATPGAVLKVGGGTAVSLGTLLAGLREVIGGSR